MVLVGILLQGLLLIGQSKGDLYLSRFLPGGPDLSGTEVTLFNASEQEISLDKYILVSRYWRVVLSEKAKIAPYSSITLGAVSGVGVFSFSDFAGFSKLTTSSLELGDFVALLGPQGSAMIDGFYLAEQPQIDFLPVSFSIQGNSISVPAENHPKWAYLQSLPDPIMAFDRNNGAWRANSRRGTLFPATQYDFLQARMTEEGLVSIKWKTKFENGCLFHQIERSSDGRNFESIGKRPGEKVSNGLKDYVYIDQSAQVNQKYWYRISHEDQSGNRVLSEIQAIATSESAAGFRFSVFREGPETGQYLRIRYASRIAQEVRLKLLDEQLRQIEVLSTGTIEPNREYLVTYRRSLAAGIYYLLVETNQERYHEVVVIQ